MSSSTTSSKQPATELTVKLNNGVDMPVLGFGTYQIKGYDVIKQCLKAAIVESKYKLIDTAAAYGNEKDIAKAMSELGIDRSDVFLTSKLKPADQGKERAAKAIATTLENLNTDHLDLYLIHWPGCGGLPENDERNAVLRRETWEVLVKHQKKGALRCIGVSNYEPRHLEDLHKHSKVLPQVNQCEVHPFYQQHTLKKYCDGMDIHVTAYSSLGTTVGGGKTNPLLTCPQVTAAADSLMCTPAQLLLLWAADRGHSVLPKSTDPQHIADNAKFNNVKMTAEIKKTLDGLERGEKFSWNPKDVA